MMSWDERQEHQWRTGHSRYGGFGGSMMTFRDRGWVCLICRPDLAEEATAEQSRRVLNRMLGWRVALLVGFAVFFLVVVLAVAIGSARG